MVYTRRSMLKRILTLFMTVLVSTMSLAACNSASALSGPSKLESNTSKSAAATASAAAGAEPFKLDIMLRYHTAVQPAADNQAVREIERITNTKLNLKWTALAAYDDKINVTIASGEYPMVMLITGNSKPIPVEVEAVRAGMFWKVQDYLGDYKYLKELNPNTIKNASIDGELWGMFRSRPLARDGFYYRTDWMRKLGLGKPKNPEDVYRMLKAFVENDPDGNGKKDTGGMAQESSLGGVFTVIGPWFGLANQWDAADGKLIPVHMQDRYVDMLRYIKRLYDEGLMNKDFPAVNGAKRDEMMADNYGLAMISIDKGINSYGALKQLHPEADFTVQQVFDDAKDKYIWGRAGFDGKFYISKKAVPKEADVRNIMEYFNLMHSPEISNLVAYGFSGRHYTGVNDRQITISSEQNAMFLKEVYVMEQLSFRYTKNNYEVSNQPPYVKQYTDMFNGNEGLTRADPTAAFNSETYIDKGRDLDRIISDAGIRFVTGKIDEAGWRSEVDRWRKSGGDKVIAEYQALYDKKK